MPMAVHSSLEICAFMEPLGIIKAKMSIFRYACNKHLKKLQISAAETQKCVDVSGGNLKGSVFQWRKLISTKECAYFPGGN